MRTRALFISIVLIAASSATAAPTIRFEFGEGLRHIAVPQLVGLQVVNAGQKADFVVSAKLEWAFGKPNVAVWLSPYIEEANAAYARCDRYPSCKTLAAYNDLVLENLFYQALDQALFQDHRGLGVLMISECTPESTRATVAVTSARNVGLDPRFYYIVTRINKEGRLVVGDSSQYELSLVERHSDKVGVFEPFTDVDETMKLVKKICGQPVRDDKTGYPLMLQLRPPDLRWDVQARNARTQ